MNRNDGRSSIGDTFGGLTGPLKKVPSAPSVRRAATPTQQAVHHVTQLNQIAAVGEVC